MRVYLRKAASLLVSAVIASFVVFAFLSVLPGDPAEVVLGTNAGEAELAALRHDFGTDRPLVVQYADWAQGLLHGDFGTSYISHDAIGPRIADRFGVTCWLALGGMLVAVLFALPAGVLAAAWHRRPAGALLSALSQAGIAIPAFLAGILLVYVFAVRAGALPAGGYTPLAEDPAAWARQLVLPCLSLGLVQGAVLTRYVRSAVLTVLHQDFLRTARAKGRRRRAALWRHGLPNAAVPVLTVLGLQLSTVLVGAVVVERVFVIPGLGDLLLQSVADRDLLVVQGVVIVLVVAVLVVNVVTDLLYHLLDPRLRSRS
ncbi:ABC transporter permease [Streptomyces telluris]|uniref:ABC transporter permease n=1 Tax=Streptomyces telluris TaxID=2720021 RepID=A0A9X2RQB7_9ACTN|nr:ABC transporter permease [Streptomyces telluris]MCQ8772321.1 ABC transporter permease [Streptomyces telluris]NJP81974.1 ABC transporter permease [Streptomyces telluris]